MYLLGRPHGQPDAAPLAVCLVGLAWRPAEPLDRALLFWYNVSMAERLVARAVEPLWHEGMPIATYLSEEYSFTPYTAERHRVFELNCVLQGRQVRHSAGSYTEVGPGDVWLVSGWEPHGWQPVAPRTTIVTALFLPEFLGDATVGGLPWLSLFACPAEQRPRSRTDEQRREVAALAQHLVRGTPTSTSRRRDRVATRGGARWRTTAISRQFMPGEGELPPAWEDGVRYDLLRLLVALYREWEGRDEVRQQPRVRVGDLSVVLPAIRLTMSDAAGRRRTTLTEAAAACSLSATHFRRLFRRAMGSTFQRFELQQRTAAAERLLHTTDLTLEAVAARCGFADASHLNRVFRGLHGHTAGAHRDAFASLPGE